MSWFSFEVVAVDGTIYSVEFMAHDYERRFQALDLFKRGDAVFTQT